MTAASLVAASLALADATRAAQPHIRTVAPLDDYGATNWALRCSCGYWDEQTEAPRADWACPIELELMASARRRARREGER